MSSFTQFDGSLDLHYLININKWSVITPFMFYLDHEGSHKQVRIPQGFVTDGASAPRPLWSIVPPWGQYGQAAVVHDYLCEGGVVYVDDVPMKVDRAWADEIFLEAMEVLKVPKWKRLAMYIGVRAYAIATFKS